MRRAICLVLTSCLRCEQFSCCSMSGNMTISVYLVNISLFYCKYGVCLKRMIWQSAHLINVRMSSKWQMNFAYMVTKLDFKLFLLVLISLKYIYILSVCSFWCGNCLWVLPSTMCCHLVWCRVLPSVLWHCWLDIRKCIRLVKIEWWVLAWLSVCSNVQVICIWSSTPADATDTPSSLALFKSRLV